MNPTKTLSETYLLAWAVDMKKDTRLNWALQFIGMLWFVLAGWVLWEVIAILRPDFLTQQINFTLGFLVGVLMVIFVTLLLHELVHGLFFWLFTRERPAFGVGPGYAYAAAPAWYFPKREYLVIGLSPLLVLTVLGLLMIAVIPPAWLWIAFLAVVFNAGGAVGDLYICLRILGETGEICIRDSGDAFEIYRLRME